MKKGLSYLLTAVALLVSGAASMGCAFILLDEPDASGIIAD